MPSTTSTVPLASAPAGSLPTSTTDSFSPSSSARAAAMSTSIPMILPLPIPARGGFSVLTPTRRVPSSPMTGGATSADFSSGW